VQAVGEWGNLSLHGDAYSRAATSPAERRRRHGRFRADHLWAERSDGRLAGQMIRVHGRAVVAIDRAAIDQNVAAAVRADVAKRYRRKCLALTVCHYAK